MYPLSDVGINQPPYFAGDVDVGGVVTQISAGESHTCALLDTGGVRCWGNGFGGRLGLGNTDHVGDDELPSSVAEIDIGGTAIQISAGGEHTCALLDDHAVRCWGVGVYGALGYGNTQTIGDNEAPASAGNVDVGGPVAKLATGHRHTCALLESGGVRCWGSLEGNRNSDFGVLGYPNYPELEIGDNETPRCVWCPW